MSTIVAATQTADRIDYWLRRYLIPHCYEPHPSQRQSKFNPARDRRVFSCDLSGSSVCAPCVDCEPSFYPSMLGS